MWLGISTLAPNLNCEHKYWYLFRPRRSIYYCLNVKTIYNVYINIIYAKFKNKTTYIHSRLHALLIPYPKLSEACPSLCPLYIRFGGCPRKWGTNAGPIDRLTRRVNWPWDWTLALCVLNQIFEAFCPSMKKGVSSTFIERDLLLVSYDLLY